MDGLDLEFLCRIFVQILIGLTLEVRFTFLHRQHNYFFFVIGSDVQNFFLERV